VSRSLIIVLALLPQVALAHGVQVTVSAGEEAIVGQVTYADGSALVDASIKLSRPDSSTIDRTLGQSRTNDEGRFAFPTPRDGGELLITADDGLGHRGTVIVRPAEYVPSSPATPHAAPDASGAALHVADNSGSSSNWARWVSGLGYLLGLFGAVSWWISRRGASRSRD
jgi:hypothetical protein